MTVVQLISSACIQSVNSYSVHSSFTIVKPHAFFHSCFLASKWYGWFTCHNLNFLRLSNFY